MFVDIGVSNIYGFRIHFLSQISIVWFATRRTAATRTGWYMPCLCISSSLHRMVMIVIFFTLREVFSVYLQSAHWAAAQAEHCCNYHLAAEKRATTVKDFRPVSLIHSFPKLVSKVLALRVDSSLIGKVLSSRKETYKTISFIWVILLEHTTEQRHYLLKVIGCSSLRGGGGELDTLKILTYGSN